MMTVSLIEILNDIECLTGFLRSAMSAGLFTRSTSSSPLRAPTDSRRTIAVSTADDSDAIEAAEAIPTVIDAVAVSGESNVGN